ncbi:dihydrolipoyllysine-residue succinyltransferase [Desulfonema ishimotonii]|uniref:Dihydrolipoyllysine-residue succinyltransferase component of 2-oxoglutarate dehydrogenase complex n=1 Tax=Desulfonema ishimotonii TaxID=45657 RepID=A0A401FVT3_9BACT|nr:2-oxoglutarate dehydrogenase complex dihydrolipoyllysine-residue succinyltransferase [Desulfonema ishimotonii]GBC61063.1 dihydrolipoyllysine-residue succinyltransferase [Desulfonema ishimotonii]
MELEIKVPSVGESVQEAILAQWIRQDGEVVKKDEPIFVIETDKITLEVNAEADGVLKILVQEGETVAIGAVVGAISTEGAAAQVAPAPKPEVETQAPEPSPETPSVPEPAPETPEIGGVSWDVKDFSPSVRRLVAQTDVDISKVTGTGPGGRVTKGDVLLYRESLSTAPPPPAAPTASPAPAAPSAPEEETVRKAMTPIRKRIAARLLEAKQNTAMLTTFNDIDMSRAMDIRTRYKEAFKKKHDVSLGFMSFFVKACVQALSEFPEINAFIEGDEVVYHNYHHVGIAVGSPKGLVVPVIRHADRLSFAGVEKAIVDYVAKIRENRLELADLEGATFTITNGGVFGSLLSTPILNTPQSGILGMHRIEKRPVVVADEIVIRPMMYVALSYDHRIVDGREAVTFLKRIKECVENPERLLMEV